MDNEKYGIELELITGKFKQKIQEVKNAFKGVGNKKITVDANTNFLQREFEIASNQVEDLRYKLKALKSEQSKLFEWQKETPKARALANEIGKVSVQLEKAGLRADKLASRLDKAGIESKQIKTSFGTGTSAIFGNIEKMTSKIKRFGLALLSIRSIWALVSRASSAYLAQDTELAAKLQNVWVGLGAILAPVIELIAGLIAKAVTFINYLIKALTGVDLIAKATTKSVKGTTGAVKGLNKALASFDELQNLDTEAGGGRCRWIIK